MGNRVKRRLRLGTPAEVRRALNRVANMVLNNEIGTKEANAIIFACNSVLSSIRIDEQERRIEEIENMLDENGIS